MQLPQIRMHSQMAKISIHQELGKQSIRQPKAAMSIQQPKADLSIHSTKPKLEIDQRQAFAEAGIKHIFQVISENANRGKQGVKEGMKRRVSQGDAMMRIENDGDPIVEQAIQNGHDSKKSLGIKFIPSVFSVKYNYIPGSVQIDARANNVKVDVNIRKPEINYQRSPVEIAIKQYQQLDIDYVNLFSERV